MPSRLCGKDCRTWELTCNGVHGLNCVGLPSDQSKFASFCNVQEIKEVERNAAAAYTAHVASIANGPERTAKCSGRVAI